MVFNRGHAAFPSGVGDLIGANDRILTINTKGHLFYFFGPTYRRFVRDAINTSILAESEELIQMFQQLGGADGAHCGSGEERLGAYLDYLVRLHDIDVVLFVTRPGRHLGWFVNIAPAIQKTKQWSEVFDASSVRDRLRIRVYSRVKSGPSGLESIADCLRRKPGN